MIDVLWRVVAKRKTTMAGEDAEMLFVSWFESEPQAIEWAEWIASGRGEVLSIETWYRKLTVQSVKVKGNEIQSN